MSEPIRGQAMPFREQISLLLSARLNSVRLSNYYTAKNNNGQIALYSTAPGALDNEVFGIHMGDLQCLYDFFSEVYRQKNPGQNILEDHNAAEQFIKELQDLAPEKPRKAVKFSDKLEKDVPPSAV